MDIRTVRRWLSGQAPYARHRGKVARALDAIEHDLWPDIAQPAPAVETAIDAERTALGETLAGYARADLPGAPTVEALIGTATERIDLLDDTLIRLLGRPGLSELLAAKAGDSCRARILAAEPGPYITPLLGVSGIEVRAGDYPGRRAPRRRRDAREPQPR